MTEKPMLIAPRVKSPDYGDFLRRALSRSGPGGHPFARTMAEQESADRQNSVAASAGTAGERTEPSGPRGTARPDPAGSKTRPVAETMSGESGGAATRSAGLPLRKGEGSAGGSLRAPGGIGLDVRSLFTLQRLARAPEETPRTVGKTADEGSRELGRLSARYESGSAGVAAVGYDRNGGTSYGKYQISSRQGTFDRFLEYLSGEAPDIAGRLRRAGKPNTGGRRGAVPEEWKRVAAEQPERFERLQEDFIRQSHFQPALEAVKGSLGVEELSEPLQEVLWSTAVQHGPAGARRIFERAARRVGAGGQEALDERAMIDAVYAVRKGQFSSSTPTVQAAVRRRFDDERRQALAMLEAKTVPA